MTRYQALTDLLSKVEAGDAVAFDPAFERALYFPAQDMNRVYLANDANKGDLNAAVSLLGAVLPGWVWNLAPTYAHVMPPTDNGDQQASSGSADTPARALLIAILKALLEQEPPND